LAILVALNSHGAESPVFLVQPQPPTTTKNGGRQLIIFIKVITALILIIISWLQISRAAGALVADYYFNKIYYNFDSSDLPAVFLWQDYLHQEAPNPINQAFYDYSVADSLGALYPNLVDPGQRRLVRQKISDLNQALPSWGYQNLLIKARLNITLGDFPKPSLT